MITGFNPADMYAPTISAAYSRPIPGVFSGIGEFSDPQGVRLGQSRRRDGELNNPALDRILDFAGEAGLVVILHCDIDVPFTKGDQLPVYFEQMRDLLLRHPNTTIIWAHTGLGRVVAPAPVQATAASAQRPPRHLELMDSILSDPRLAHVYYDISWDEVAKYAVTSPEVIARSAALFDRYPDRFLFGTDNVAPPNIEANVRVFNMWAPMFAKMKPEARAAISFGNYERLFDSARRSVREWERVNVKR